MGLRLKFNIVLTLVFAIGLAVSGVVSYRLLQANARDEVLRTADLMIEVARAIRTYTVDSVRPELSHHLEERFLPQTVPAFAATEALAGLPEHYHEYTYKEATLNPTNPRDRAVDWEADLIRDFERRGGDGAVITGTRQTPTGPSLFVARPIRITDEGCLTCHSTPDAAPPSMVALYGDNNGFGWQMNEIVGAQVVTVPMTVAIENANRAFVTTMISLCAVFVVLYVILNVMLGRLIIRPVTRMSEMADRVSMGDFEIEEFEERRGGEIGRLGASFNRMRRSLEQAMRMIGD